MNKVGKRILALCLALSVICGIGSISVFADDYDSETGAISGYSTKGYSYIGQTSAYAYTSFGGNGQVTVSSTYGYVNVYTLATDSESRNDGDHSYAQVNFTAPRNCHSVYIDSDHQVVAYGQTWSTSTYATY